MECFFVIDRFKKYNLIYANNGHGLFNRQSHRPLQRAGDGLTAGTIGLL